MYYWYFTLVNLWYIINPSQNTKRIRLQKLRQPGDKGKEGEMEKAYEEYFDGLADGEEALSFAEFKEALS